MRVVLDTNVIVSSTLIRGGNEDRILRAWQEGDFDLVLSPGILEEMGRTLLYEKLSKYHRMTGRRLPRCSNPLPETAYLFLESLPSRRAEILP